MGNISLLVAFSAGLLSFLSLCVLPLVPVYLASLAGPEIFELGEQRSHIPATVKDFIQSQNYSFPVLLDTSRDVALEYNIQGYPITFLIDKDGIIQVMQFGAFANKAEIEKRLSKIIT